MRQIKKPLLDNREYIMEEGKINQISPSTFNDNLKILYTKIVKILSWPKYILLGDFVVGFSVGSIGYGLHCALTKGRARYDIMSDLANVYNTSLSVFFNQTQTCLQLQETPYNQYCQGVQVGNFFLKVLQLINDFTVENIIPECQDLQEQYCDEALARMELRILGIGGAILLGIGAVGWVASWFFCNSIPRHVCCVLSENKLSAEEENLLIQHGIQEEFLCDVQEKLYEKVIRFTVFHKDCPMQHKVVWGNIEKYLDDTTQEDKQENEQENKDAKIFSSIMKQLSS